MSKSKGTFSVGLEQAPLTQQDRIKILRERQQIDAILEEEAVKRSLVETLREKAEQSLQRLQDLEIQRDRLLSGKNHEVEKPNGSQRVILKRLATEIDLEQDQCQSIKSSLEDAQLNLARAELNRRKIDVKLEQLEECEETLEAWQQRRMVNRQEIEDANNTRREQAVENRQRRRAQAEDQRQQVLSYQAEQQRLATQKSKQFVKQTKGSITRSKEQAAQADLAFKQKRLEEVLKLKQNIERSRKGDNLPKKRILKKESEESLQKRLNDEFKLPSEKTVPLGSITKTEKQAPKSTIDPSVEEMEEKIRAERIRRALSDEKAAKADPLEKFTREEQSLLNASMNSLESAAGNSDDESRDLISLKTVAEKEAGGDSGLSSRVPSWVEQDDTVGEKLSRKMTKTQLALRKITDGSIKRHKDSLMKPRVQTVCHRTFTGPAFAANTKEVTFENVVPYQPYEKVIQMTNISYSMNSLKFLKVSGDIADFLSASLEQQEGQLSAGMSLSLTLKLKTKVSRDLRGDLNFVCSTGPFSIPVFSYLPRFMPVFSEKQLDFGNVVIGQVLAKKFMVRNIGKLGGVVTLKTPDDIQDFEIVEAFDTFRLSSDEEKEINVKFYGRDAGARESSLRMHFESDHVVTEHVESKTAFQEFESEEVDDDDLIAGSGSQAGAEAEDVYKVEPVDVRLLACTLECPISLEDDILDIKMCFIKQLYQIPFLVQSNASSSVKIKMHIPPVCREFIQVLPEDAVVPGHGQITALVRVNSQVLPQDNEYFSADTGLFDVPIEIRLQNHEKATPAVFRVVGILSTDHLSLSTTQLDFGQTLLEEETTHTILVRNHSQHISRTIGFVGLPNWMVVSPNFCKLLPDENLPITFRFRPTPSQGLHYKERVQLRCIETPNIVTHIDVRGELNDTAPLKLSEQKVGFSNVAIGDVVSGRVELFHTGTQSGDFSFRILTDKISQETTGNSELVDFQLQVAPGCAVVNPSGRVGLAIRTCPVLRQIAVDEKFKTVYEQCLQEKKARLRAEMEEAANAAKALREAEALASAESGKSKGKKKSADKKSAKPGSGTKSARSKPESSTSASEGLTLESIEKTDLTPSEITQVGLTAKALLLDALNLTEPTEFTIPVLVACGHCIDPTTNLIIASSQSLKYLPNATLYLKVNVSVTRPVVVIERSVDFGKVCVGTSHVRTIHGEKLDAARRVRFHLPTVIDAYGMFSLQKALRTCDENDADLPTPFSISVKCETSCTDKAVIYREEPRLQVLDADTGRLLHGLNLSITAQTSLPKVAFVEKLPGAQFSLENLDPPTTMNSPRSNRTSKMNSPRMTKTNSKQGSKGSSPANSVIEQEIKRAQEFDKFLEVVDTKTVHEVDFGIVPSRVPANRYFEIRNRSDVSVNLEFKVVADEKSDLNPDGVSSAFDIMPRRKLTLEKGEYGVCMIQALSKHLESYNKAKLLLYAKNFADQVLHTVDLICRTTSLPAYISNPTDVPSSLVNLNTCRNYHAENETNADSLVLSTKLHFTRTTTVQKLTLGLMQNLANVKSVDFIIDDPNTIAKLGFEVCCEKKVPLTPGSQEEIELKWTPMSKPHDELIQQALKENIINWIDVGQEMSTNFSISAKIEAKTYVWNVYLSGVL